MWEIARSDHKDGIIKPVAVASSKSDMDKITSTLALRAALANDHDVTVVNARREYRPSPFPR